MRNLLILAAAFLALPVAAFADDDDDRGRRHWKDHGRHGYERTERYWRDGCLVERTWKGHGRFDERIDCRHDDRGRHHGRYDQRWHDDSWRGHDSRYYSTRPRHDQYDGAVLIGGFFDDRARHVVSRYYGRDCDRWGKGHRRGYYVGRPLPHDLRYHALPYDLYHRLPAPPRGHAYVRVDRDVLLVAEATKNVIDALVLVSAID